MKKMKRYILLLALLIIVIATTAVAVWWQMKSSETPKREYQTMFTPNVLNDTKERVIEKETVVKKLKSTSQLIGLTGEYEKEVTYQDIKPVIDVSWLEKFSSREYTASVKGTYSFGIDLSKITSDHVIVDNDKGKVTIVIPKAALLSFDMPYDTAHYQTVKQAGFLAEEFTSKDDQKMYEYVYKKVNDDVKNNKSLQEKAQKQTEKALRNLLTVLPGVEEVVPVTP